MEKIIYSFPGKIIYHIFSKNVLTLFLSYVIILLSGEGKEPHTDTDRSLGGLNKGGFTKAFLLRKRIEPKIPNGGSKRFK